MVHSYKLNDYNIVLDVFSGAIHLLDDTSFEMLQHLDAPPERDYPEELSESMGDSLELREIYAELYELYEAGLLFSEDDYAKYQNMLVDSPVKALCLHIAHDCNLKCGYCFASEGNFGGNSCLMSFEVAKKAIDLLVKESGNRKNLEVDFFGGEPLMNFEVVKKTVDYARSLEKKHQKFFRFTITTNGLLLSDDKIDYINREMSNVVLSIDGRPEVNDQMRKCMNGEGSYKHILPNFEKMVNSRGDKDYYVRGTFTKNNLDFGEDVMHLSDIGFEQISVEPVVLDETVPFSLTKEDLPSIFSEYESLAKKLIEEKKAGKKINFFHFMIDLEQGPCAIKRLRGCGCGNEYMAVTPEGDIYPCHQFVGNPEWIMGTVDTGLTTRDMKEEFAEANIYSKTNCTTCWARFYCSGGCNANNWQYCGDIHHSHELSCELEKKRVECAIMLNIALQE